MRRWITVLVLCFLAAVLAAVLAVPGRAQERQEIVVWHSYQGAARLAEIVAGLQAHGWSPETPAAVIHNGSTPQQQVITGTLGGIAAQAAHLKSPSTIVIGEVVSLSASIRWFEPEIAFS